MATTGFWPVKDRLKEVIDYVGNPDETIDKKYVNSDATAEAIRAKLLDNQRHVGYIPFHKPKYTPLVIRS